MYSDAALNTYPLSIVDTLGNVIIPIIYFQPFTFIAETINAVFTIEPTIICEFDAITLFAPNTFVKICAKNVGTSNAPIQINIICIISICFE